MWFVFFFQAEDGIRDAQESRGLGDVYKRQIKLIVGRIADAAEEGRLMRKDEEIEEELPESRSVISRKIDEDIELGDDELLGEATRAKIPVKEDLESDDTTSEA